ncbi:MBL fold metallo-hydrolase [Candidatus Berkelbacteria bacterium]|nr:MBL fold metallo-hydrolase [Candidatus Berkelbacteria bacterium]
MEIRFLGEGDFEIKSGENLIKTGQTTAVNDVSLDGPGEYEIARIMVLGFNPQIFLFKTEALNLVHLGKLDRPLTDAELEHLNNVDILIVSLEGGSKKALELINQIEPKIVIPASFSPPNGGPSGELESFCKEEGGCEPAMNVLRVSKGSLPEEERKVVVLNAVSASKAKKED